MFNLTRCTTCSSILPHENDFNSPLSSYLGTYNALNLSTPEKQLAQKSVDAIDTELTSLDDHIAHLTRLRHRLRTHRDECKSLLSRTRALPNEILSTIFALCLEQQTSSPLYENAPQKHPQLQIRLPLPMAAVCQRWRAVAHSTPRLWTTLKASLGYNTTLAQANAFGVLATTFAERSGALPLHIDLQLQDTISAPAYHAVQHTTSHISTAAALCATAPRWASACITFSPRSYIYHTLVHLLGTLASESGPSAFARLESLALLCTTFYSWHPLEGVLPLPPAPRLRTVKLALIDPAQLSLPWAQLQELSLAQLHWHVVHHALQQCTALVCLRVEVEVYDAAFTVAPPVTAPLELPHLKFLGLLLTDPTTLGVSLHGLTLPALRSLSLKFISTPDADWFAHYQNFLARSQCTIESLTLEDMCMPDDGPGWAVYLAAFPHLTTLVLVETDWKPWSDILLMLAGDASVVPRLETLDSTVSDRGSAAAACDLAADMIEARWAGGTRSLGSGCLKSFVLRGPLGGGVENTPSFAGVAGLCGRGFAFEVVSSE